MTLIDGELDTDDKDEVLEQLISNAEDAFSRDFSEDEAVVIREFYDPVASYFASQQQDIQDVLDSTRLGSAEGGSLDFIGDRLGVPRFGAKAAGVDIEFISDSRISQDNSYTIPDGQGVQTDDADPVKFETEDSDQLRFLDGFEDNDIAEYSGDTGIFTTQGTTVYEGSYALEGSASSGVIVDANNEVPQGSTIHVRVQVNSGAKAAFLFGVDNTSNYYRVLVDSANDVFSAERVDDGTVTTIVSTSVTVPTGSWLDCEIDWNHDGNIVATLDDSSGTEIASIDGTDGADVPYTDGGIGFESADATAKKWFDNATMSSVSLPAKSTSKDSDANVGSNTLIVLSTSVNGIDDVTNPIPASGGRNKETDPNYRDRVRTQLSEGTRATQPALIHHLDQLTPVRTVTVIVNDSSTDDSDGRPPHSFEAVTDMDNNSDNRTLVAETILETKAAGDIPVGGFAGTSVSETIEMSNGQKKTIEFSLPSSVKIYVDVSLTKKSTYPGDDAVQDSIVQYIGGTLNSGDTVAGEIGVGDDVIYNQVLEAVMDVEGVHDISNLDVGTSSDPTGTSNISISDTETADADATDTSLDVTSSDA